MHLVVSFFGLSVKWGTSQFFVVELRHASSSDHFSAHVIRV